MANTLTPDCYAHGCSDGVPEPLKDQIARLRTLLDQARTVIEYRLHETPTTKMAEAVLAEIEEVLGEMNNWEPTMNLRFVQRLERKGPQGKTVRTLQQQWRCKEQKGYGLSPEWDYEWRDVPEALESR